MWFPQPGFNKDSAICHVYPMANSESLAKVLCDKSWGLVPKTRIQKNVYLDTQLSVKDWCRMEVHIFPQPKRVARGCAK